MKNTYNDRQFVIYLIFLSIGIIFVLRLFFIQIIEDRYKISADNNVLRYDTDYPLRGLIYDRNGELLVYNEASYDLMITPRLVKKLDTLEFCQLIGIEKDLFKTKFKIAKNYSPYKPSIFEKQISKETYASLQEKMHNFPGFYVQPRTLRRYPKPIAGHVLGYIGEVTQDQIDNDNYYKSGDYIGISGIEKSYEKALRGKKGLRIKLVDVFNREKGSYEKGKFDTVSTPGYNLYSSIDAKLQEYGEKLMADKRGSIVAIEPATGEILTVVSSPNYDPNLLVGRERSKNYVKLLADKVNKPLFNRALVAQYSPGSTFKMINALIGLQEGVLTTNTRYSCSSGYRLGGLTIRCHPHASPLDVYESIQYSCNSFYCYAFRSIIDNKKYKAARDGFIVWRSYLKSFGIGEKLESDLPNVGRGNVPTPEYYDKLHGSKRWNSFSIISLAIGQGELAITPFQMANIAATIANRGYYIAPHILRALGTKNNHLSKFKNKNLTKVEKKNFDIIVEAMYRVVENGTARIAKIDSIEVCGKTGTVQNTQGMNHSSFIAFAPRNNPKIAISVFVENSGYGATWAAPIASLMIERYLKGKVKRLELEERMISGQIIPSDERD